MITNIITDAKDIFFNNKTILQTKNLSFGTQD